MAKKTKKTVKDDFDFKTWIKELSINKYLKTGFIASLEDKIPKSENESKKLLKKYLGE